MADVSLTALLWGVSVVPLICLTTALCYLYYQDREKRKLMFAVAIGIACLGYLYKMLEGSGGLIAIEYSFGWSSFPLLSAVTIASVSSLLKLKKFDKPFRLFLLACGVSLFLLFFNSEKASYVLLYSILSIFSFASVSKLITSTRERSDLMFLLALLFFMFSGIGLSMDFVPEFTVITSFLGVWFTALMLATSKRSAEESMTSFFVLKEEIASVKRKFSMLFNLVPDPAVIVDETGRFLEISNRIVEVTGYKREELVGRNFSEIVVVDSTNEASLSKNFVDWTTGSNAAPYEAKVISKDGRELIFELNAATIDYGSGQANLVVIRDRTERKKMEQSLLDSEKKFHAMTTFAKYAIILTDGDGVISYWNLAAEKTFGFTKEETVGKRIFEFLVPERFHAEFERVFWEEFKKREQGGSIGKSIELLSVAKNGREFPTELSLSGFRTRDGWNAACIVHDITGRKRMQEQLVKSEKFAAVGELATMVAHDLRNPLQGILNATYYLKNKLNGNMDKNMLGMLELIKNDVKYCNKIVSDLLDYSRDVKLDLDEVALRLVVEESFSLIEVPANILVTERIPDSLIVEIDSESMKRVFVNIIKNAVDAMPDGGTFVIESKVLGENVELMFKDTGVGMNQQTVEQLFTPLFTTKAKGMGFGLAICKRLVEAHGGTISVESAVGKGTCFKITIPLSALQKREETDRGWAIVPEPLHDEMLGLRKLGLSS